MLINSVEFWQFVAIAIAVLFVVFAVSTWGSMWLERRDTKGWRREPDHSWWAQWLQGLSTEMVGAFVTAAIFTVGFSLILEKQQKEAEVTLLLRQINSSDHSLAMEAFYILDYHGWLEDGTLRDRYISGADLHGAYFGLTDLRGMTFYDTNLKGAYLGNTNLSNAELYRLNLQEADLSSANLERAYLSSVDFQNADLSYIDLEGASGLTCAQLGESKSLMAATLPDGTFLPDEGDWRAVFDAWCETVVLDENGCIEPVRLDTSEEQTTEN